ncbi:MAG: 4Fe-4S binding protein [Treponema sp.]|jgi:ferredoxin|nr:4Fe-4S binding protein [Treponema sp.]
MKRPLKARLFRRFPALFRAGLSILVLGLFFYVYLSKSLSSNGALSLVMKGQFSPSLYGAGIAGLTILAGLALSLLFGRIFCSVLCPLGTLQELFWRAGNFLRDLRAKRGKVPGAGKENRRPGGKDKALARGAARSGYRALPGIRYAAPLLTGLGLALSFSPLMVALDPVSNFGRGMGAFRLLGGGNAAPFALILALPFVLILGLAFFRGRVFCRWCPVGLTLGLLSPAAPFGMKVSSRCLSCGICEKKCPAACIDSRSKRIESDRCVLCFSCAAACPGGSVNYGLRGKAALAGESRRFFLKGAGKASLLCGAVYLLGPSLRLFSVSAARGGKNPILPPGALNGGGYRARCAGCQACVAACPVGIIKTRDSPRPALDYTDAGCQYNCLECGKVCPTGAIRRLDTEEKHRIRVALSSLSFERCVVNVKRESCGACAEVCPTGAITMAAYSESGVPWLTRPLLDEQYCIGCGACFAACPAEPRALSLEAVPEQTLTAGPRPAGEGGEGFLIENMDEFPF